MAKLQIFAFTVLVCALLQTSSAPAAPCSVSIDAAGPLTEINPKLMGVNLVYSKESDSYWSNGTVANHLKDLGCGFLRWPGGEVNSYVHWNDMIASAQVDTWNPSWNGKRGSASSYMNLDEYITLQRKVGCEPLVGVNMESGAKYNREQKGVDDAKALVQYCKDKGYNVKYWFMDNESYLNNTSNNYHFTATEYADHVNTYANAMKTVDPNILIICNWTSAWSTEWSTIVSKCGSNIDIMDNHLYWMNGGGVDWAKWLGQTPMSWNGKSYKTIISGERTGLKGLGREDVQLASFEWNVGPQPSTSLSYYQAALMEAEQFGQYISAGMDMACMWPMHGSDDYRQMFTSSGAPHANFQMFGMYKDVMGQKRITGTSDHPEVPVVAALSNDGSTLWVYLLRKTGEGVADLEVNLQLKGFAPGSATARVFYAASLSSNTPTITDLPVTSMIPITLSLPAHSFTQITLHRADSRSRTWTQYAN